MKRPMVCLVRD